MQGPLLGREGDTAVVNLLIEGLRCAACSWLIGESLGRLPGIVRASVNPATARAQVAFDPQRLGLAAVLRAIAALGYRPHVLGATDTLAVATRERRQALKRVAVAGFGMMQVMMIAAALYIGAVDGMDPVIREYLRIISLVVTAPVLVYAGRPFFAGAYASLRARHVGMDVPVAIGIGLAFVASAWNTLHHSGDVYFDSVVMFIFLLLLGRYVEMLARHRAGSTAEALLRLVPATALRMAGEVRERVPVASLAAGDRVLVPVGECFPADGVLAAGATEADEALLTGESLPVAKAAGAHVIAGALNCGAPVEVELTAVGQSTVLAGIVRLLERAQTERPRIARLADRAAAWFVGRVLIGAALVAVLWLIVDPSRAFEATLAVLVVTCPCALSLATPTAITAATATLARAGLLVTRPDALEELARADTVLFDKTGTLSLGRPRLERVATFGLGADQALCIAAALERASAHPLAQAFETIAAAPAEDAAVYPGCGIEGCVGAVRYRIGTAAFVAALAGARPATAAESGVHLGSAGRWLARFEIGDALRPGAAGVVRELEALGLTPSIASGDHAEAVAHAAGALGIRRWHARQLPADKLALLAAAARRRRPRARRRRRHQRRADAARGVRVARTRHGLGTCAGERRPRCAARRPVDAAARGAHRAPHDRHHPPEPRLGGRLQPGGTAAGRARLGAAVAGVGRHVDELAAGGAERAAARAPAAAGRAGPASTHAGAGSARHMSIIFVLIPLGLVLVGFALWAFFWAVGDGQFDDLESPGWSVLADERAPPPEEAPR